MRVLNRLPPRTNPCKRLPPKIPNPLPKTAGAPAHTEAGCRFYDLKAKATPPPSLPTQLPPLLNSMVGRIVKPNELAGMRRLRASNPKRWTITALTNKFGINRGYVIKHVLTQEENKLAEEELTERIDSLSLNQKRGWLTKYKIREHRRNLW